MNTVSLNILIHRFLKIHETFVSNRYLGVELLVTFELLEPHTLPQMWLKMTFCGSVWRSQGSLVPDPASELQRERA